MSQELSNLKPELLWQIFEEICNIPHPSKYEGKMDEVEKHYDANKSEKKI